MDDDDARLPSGVRVASRAARILPKRTRVRLLRAIRRRVAGDLLSIVTEGAATFSRLPITCDVLVYFGDPPKNLYQLRQWLPPLEELNTAHRVCILTREAATFSALRDETKLPVICVKRFDEMDDLYRSNEFKVCLYVNNSATNFQSLTFQNLLHVHLNHGESDKISMASNQAKAYDQVFVAGQAAVDRYLANLIEFDGSTLRIVGRPQLDQRYPSYPRPSALPTILYAPTWEGGRDAMDYTSLDRLGLGIVKQILASGRFRLIYRPHPKAGARRQAVADADRRIRDMINAARSRDRKAAHVIDDVSPIGQIMEVAVAMIADVSSVTLDFLATGKPLFITDPRNDREGLFTESPAARSTYVVDARTSDVAAEIASVLDDDVRKQEREKAIDYYFGDVTEGSSTKRFVAAVGDAIRRRDELMSQKRGI